MASNIQQSLNQALFQAQIAAGIYARSPQAIERRELKAESKKEESIESRLNTLKEDIKGAGSISSETETAVKGVLEEKADLQKKQFQRDPAAYQENYLSTLQDIDILETQGRLPYAGINQFVTESYKQRAETKANQKAGLEQRKSILLDPYGKSMEVNENGNK